MRTVLIVDDDPRIRKLLVRELAPEFQVIEASDYFQALDIMQRNADISLVLSDYDFGNGPNGQDLLEKLRSQKPDVPRVMISGSLEANVHAAIVVSGVAQLFIQKPWDPGYLGDMVQKLLAENQTGRIGGDGQRASG